MNKKIILSLVLIMALSLSGCGKKDAEVNNNGGSDKASEVSSEKSMINWLKSGKTVECVIESPEGNIVVKTKKDFVLMEGVPYFSMNSSGEMPEASNGVMLTVGDWTYTWDNATKKGTKMNMKEMEEMGLGDEDEEEGEDWDDMAQEWEDSEFEYNCREIKVNDNIFDVPKDVDFQDLSEMMSGYMDISDGLQEQAEMGETIDVEELEKMMQDMQGL